MFTQDSSRSRRSKGDRIKGIIAIMVSNMIIYMFASNKYHKSIAAMISEKLGIRDFLERYSINVLIFFLCIWIALMVIKEFGIKKGGINKWRVLLISLLSMIVFVRISAVTFEYIKENGKGLNSMSMGDRGGYLEIVALDGVLKNFDFGIQIKNFSKEPREFTVKIPVRNLWGKEEFIEIVNKDGTPVIFKLQGRETKNFTLSKKDYMIHEINLKTIAITKRGGWSGSFFLRYVLLENEDDEYYLYKMRN